MSKLEELIQELCPNGVEFVPLWSITAWDKKFNAVDKAMQPKVYKYPVLLAKDLFAMQQEKGDVFLLSTGTETGWTTEKIAGDYLCKGEVVTLPWGKSSPVKGLIKYYNGKFVTGDNRIATSLDTEKLLNKYLYYWMVNQGDVIDTFYRGSGIKHPSMFHVLTMTIPVPPMEVQREIVRLLDDFTAKTAELLEELNREYEARKKQYEYYKEVLLCNNENVDKVKIKDIVCKTNKIKWNQTENTYQYIDLSSVDRETHTLLNTSIIDRNNAPSRAQQIVCVDDVLFGTTRPMLKRLFVIPDEYDGQICSTGFCVLRAIDNIVQPKWIYHVLNTTQFYSYVESHQQGTSYPSISDSLVKEYEITLPSLDEQIRIINILDNLEETNFELNNNLSLELESRQKQYEFYRDKLLTFKELS